MALLIESWDRIKAAKEDSNLSDAQQVALADAGLRIIADMNRHTLASLRQSKNAHKTLARAVHVARNPLQCIQQPVA